MQSGENKTIYKPSLLLVERGILMKECSNCKKQLTGLKGLLPIIKDVKSKEVFCSLKCRSEYLKKGGAADVSQYREEKKQPTLLIKLGICLAGGGLFIYFVPFFPLILKWGGAPSESVAEHMAIWHTGAIWAIIGGITLTLIGLIVSVITRQTHKD